MYLFFCFNSSRCHTPGGIRPRRGPAAAATKIAIESGTEIEEENLDIAALQPSLPAVNVRGEREDTDRTLAMPDPGGMSISIQLCWKNSRLLHQFWIIEPKNDTADFSSNRIAVCPNHQNHQFSCLLRPIHN